MTPPPEPAIRVESLSKSFRVPHERMHTLKERALHPLRARVHDELQALHDVTFSVGEGEFFGVIGRNGSGKSTLLRCIAGIYHHDEGSIHVSGRVSTFIELGVGFNLDLAARDNIVLNLTMLGSTYREARARVDDVLDFAELHDFVDLKLKNYSSGMMVRLGFAVMIQVDAQILLFDEILAVGDAAFAQKCETAFEQMRQDGATVVLVTHNLSALRRFCDRAMLLERGRPVAIGDPREIGNRYLQMNFSQEARAAAEAMAAAGAPARPELLGGRDERFGDGAARITEAWFEDEDGTPSMLLPTGGRYRFAMRVRFEADVSDPVFSVTMTDDRGLDLFSSSTAWTQPHPGRFARGEEAVYRVAFENILGPGNYTVTPSVTRADGRALDVRGQMFSMMVTSTRPTGALVDVPQEVSVQRVPPRDRRVSPSA